MVSTAAFHARVRGSVPGLGGFKETKMFLPHPCVKVSIVGSLRDREVACSASDRQGSNFESCVWRTVSSQSSHHPQGVLLAQFSLYVHKGGLRPDSFHLVMRSGAKTTNSVLSSLSLSVCASIHARISAIQGSYILVQVTIYRRLLIGRDGPGFDLSQGNCNAERHINLCIIGI